MPIESEGERTTWVVVQGRRVKLYAVDPDDGTQSVNVCTPVNVDGEYEEVQYFRGDFRMAPQEVDQCGDVPTLKRILRERAYRQVRD